MTNESQQAGVESGKRVPLHSSDTDRLVSVGSEFRLSGVDWDYYNLTTHILEYTYNWPAGFSAHIAWQGEGEWRVINLWSDEQLRRKFFAEEGAARLSKGINLLGAVRGPEGVTDVKPLGFTVPKFILGPRAMAFADSGEDRDGSAIHALGGEPVAIELEISGMGEHEYARLLGKLGYDTSVPTELISHHVMVEDEGIRIFETWTGSGHALVALGTTLLPAIERLGEQLDREFLCFHHEYTLQRIAINREVVDAFDFKQSID